MIFEEYKNGNFKLMDIFSQLSTIPELRQEKYRVFRKNLRSTIDDKCPMN